MSVVDPVALAKRLRRDEFCAPVDRHHLSGAEGVALADVIKAAVALQALVIRGKDGWWRGVNTLGEIDAAHDALAEALRAKETK